MDIVLGLLALVATVAVFTALARRFNLSAPLVLAAVGVVGSYLSFVPEVRLTEDLVLIGLLPPLLYAAAIRTSLVEIRSNKRSIGLLSVGYVIFAAIGVGFATYWVFDGEIPLAAALALGAVVAPPDAVAATAIARKVGMPRRIVVILEGESLINDATALVSLRTALALTAGGVTVWSVSGDFLLKAVGGTVIGLVLAMVLGKIRKHIKDITLDTTLSFAAPFAAYVAAEEAHASGVLAVVVCGLLLGHNSSILQSAGSRISERTNWATIQFLLENSVFLLIGLQVRSIVAGAHADSMGNSKIWLGCAVVLITVLVLRPIWVFPATYLPRRLSKKLRQTDPIPWQVPAVISWAGMRGVVTLAAVFVIPEDTPHRDVLVLAALVVVFGTLVLQGLSLPRLVKVLGLRGPDPREDALQHAAVLHDAAEAGRIELERIKTDDDPVAVIKALKIRSRARTDSAWERLGRTDDSETPSEKYRRLRLAMLTAERKRVLELRDTGTIPDEVLREVLEGLDVEESQLDPMMEQDRRSQHGELTVPTESLGGGCDHLREASCTVAPTTAGFCADCVREHTEPVHLRMCMACGKVACCDSSVGRHAERHFKEAGHPVMRSVEPGEAWRWCYVDEMLG